MYLRQSCIDGWLNKTQRRCSIGLRQYVYVGFSGRKIPRNSAYTISEKAIWFWHPDYNPDRAQKLISSSMSRHLLTRNISSKSTYAFLINLANRQTNERGKTHLPPPLSEVNNTQIRTQHTASNAMDTSEIEFYKTELKLQSEFLKHLKLLKSVSVSANEKQHTSLLSQNIH